MANKPLYKRLLVTNLSLFFFRSKAFFFPNSFARRHYPPNMRASSIMSSANNNMKLESPSAERNKEPIWQVLEPRLPPTSDELRVLEIAGGAGVHMHYMSHKLRQSGRSFQWFPTDSSRSCLLSQKAYLLEEGRRDRMTGVVQQPLPLTLSLDGIRERDTDSKLSDHSIDVVMNINMIHISPWSATRGLMKVAAQKLRVGGILYLYGPFRVNGTCVESNLRFEQWLKAQDPGYGVRNLEDVIEEAKLHGLEFQEIVEMPANNLSVLFRKL